MHEHVGSFTQNPSQKFHKNFINFKKSLKIFKKNQNLDLNAWNAWRMKDREIISSDLRQEKAKTHVGWRFWERRGCLGDEETDSVERDQGEVKRKSRRSFI